MSIAVIVHITFKAEKLAAGLNYFKNIIPLSRAEEGCIYFNMFQYRENPLRYVLMEEWASKAIWEKHAAAPHIADVHDDLTACFDGDFDLDWYQGTSLA